MLAGPGACSPVDHLAHEVRRPVVPRPRGTHQVGDVLHHEVADRHRENQFLNVQDAAIADDLRQHGGLAAGRLAENLLLFAEARIVHVNVEHEAVELGLRQRVGALLLDGVLRGDDEEGVGQIVGRLAHGHLAFLHGLQQGGLGLGRRAVDLVGQDDVGEDRAVDEAELARAARSFVDNIGARDIRRHQVGGELDALELQVHNRGQGPDHHRLGQARHADQQAMAADEDGRQHLVDNRQLADDDLTQFADDLVAAGLELFDQCLELLFSHPLVSPSTVVNATGILLRSSTKPVSTPRMRLIVTGRPGQFNEKLAPTRPGGRTRSAGDRVAYVAGKTWAS